MEILYLIIGLVVGAAVGALCWFMERQKSAQVLAAEREVNARLVENEKNKSDEILAAQKLKDSELQAAQKKQHEELLEAQQKQQEELLVAQQKKYEELLEAQQKKYEELLDAEKKKSKELLEAAKKDAAEQFTLLKDSFAALSEDLLKKRSTELQDSNRENMQSLFNPLKDNLNRMEKAMQDSQLNSARNTSELRTTITNMMEKASTLGQEAERLSNALLSKNKIAGNWGELVLTELLESQGLERGVHFELQETLRDEMGKVILNEDTDKAMIPDVIMHLANSRDVIIDSKVSLRAFTDYQNASDPASQKKAEEDNLASIKNHVRSLAAKSYAKYINKNQNAIDFVIMFVPIEGALQLALQTDPALLRESLEKKIFIAGSQTLLAALKIVDMAWINVQQEENTKKIVEEAQKMVDRVDTFLTHFAKAEKKLRETQEAFTGITNIARDGRQSILGAGHRLEALGVKGKKTLPRLAEED